MNCFWKAIRCIVCPIFLVQLFLHCYTLVIVIKFLLHKHAQSLVIREFSLIRRNNVLCTRTCTRELFEFLNKRQTARDISAQHPGRIEREFSECNSISRKSEIPRRRGYHLRWVIDQWIIPCTNI